MANFLSFVGDYFHTVFFNWYGVVLLVTGLVDLIERTFDIKKLTIPPWLRTTTLVSVFLIAQMFAYKDLKEKYDLKVNEPPHVINRDTEETLKKLTDLQNQVKDKDRDIASLKEMGKYQRLTLRPMLNASFAYDETGSGFRFDSLGPGPAIIKSFTVKVDNVPKRHWEEVVKAIGIPGPVTYNFTVLYPNQQAPAGLHNLLFWVKTSAASDILIKNRLRIALEICYCSLYDECWTYSDRIVEWGKPAKSCKPTPFVFVAPPQ